MTITPITEFFGTRAISQDKYMTTQPVTNKGGSFQDILTDLIGQANQTEYDDQLWSYDLANGVTDDLHTPLISAEEADLALRLTISVRNKVVEAYQEIMRMQV